MKPNEIHWNDAIEEQKRIKEQELQRKKEYEVQVQQAKTEFTERMFSKRGFTILDFDDACGMYSVEPDDLLEQLL